MGFHFTKNTIGNWMCGIFFVFRKSFCVRRLKKKNRKLDLLVSQFQKNTLSYLKQNDFNVKKAVEFENYEKTRTLKALVRLFKCMQLLPLTQSNPEKKDSG